MRSLIEMRRHSKRLIPEAHLSQEGVSLARRVGERLGPFERVITSTLPRAFETAIAMGFAVDEQNELISSLSEAVERQVPYPASFACYAAVVAQGGPAAQRAQLLRDFLARVAASLPDGRAALVINHGGILELAVAGCLPGLDYEAWGSGAGYCEGARLTWQDDRFTEAVLLRVQSS